MTTHADWHGRTALITGASRGIGRALAIELAAAGARTALLARDADRLDDVAAACLEASPDRVDAEILVLDVTDPQALVEKVPPLVARLGDRLDLLANVAGASLRHTSLVDSTDDDWMASFALHVLAPVRLARLAHPALRNAGGAVVNLGSVAAGRAPRFGAAYAATKAAVASVTRSLATEWARDGIRAVTIEPGYVETDFDAGLTTPAARESMLARVPTRRPVDAHAVARLIMSVGAPDQRDLTGATIRIDGGMTASF